MGGSYFHDEIWQQASADDAITVVLVGKPGNGKSATGNSILGRRAFLSRPNFTGVTGMCQLESALLSDGRTLNVIDTTGLSDESNDEWKNVGEAILKCLNFPMDGIHAVLVVFSLRASEEEKNMIEQLQVLFGEQIVDYMVVVFTSADLLDEYNMKFDEYLKDAPEALELVLQMCNNRFVLFDNATIDETEKAMQVHRLFFHVDSVMAAHGGRPLIFDNIFSLLKDCMWELHDKEKDAGVLKNYLSKEMDEFKKEMQKTYEEHLERITEKVEKLRKELEEEQASRRKSDEEICKLRESLEKARKESKEQCNYDEEIRKLKDSLENAQKENEERCKYDEEIQKLNESLEKAQKENEERRKYDEEIHKLKESLEKAQKETEELRNEEVRKLKESLEKAQKETEELRNEENRKLKESLEKAQKETDELRVEKISYLKESLEKTKKETEEQGKYTEEIRKLKESVEEAQKGAKELRNEEIQNRWISSATAGYTPKFKRGGSVIP